MSDLVCDDLQSEAAYKSEYAPWLSRSDLLSASPQEKEIGDDRHSERFFCSVLLFCDLMVRLTEENDDKDALDLAIRR